MPGPLHSGGDPVGPGADDHEMIDDGPCRLADPAMTIVVVVAELEHLAEDRDLASGKTGQQLQRRRHGTWRGVV